MESTRKQTNKKLNKIRQYKNEQKQKNETDNTKKVNLKH